MKQFAKGMEQNNKTLAAVLAKLINPNTIAPIGFGLPSTLNNESFTEPTESSSSYTTSSSDSILIPIRLSTPITSARGPTRESANTPASSSSGFVTPTRTPSNDSIIMQTRVSSQSNPTPTRMPSTDSSTVQSSDSIITPAESSSNDSIIRIEHNVAVSPNSDNDSNTSVLASNSSLSSDSNFGSPSVQASSSGIPHVMVRELMDQSCSRRNFSARLSRKMFDESTRSQCNVNGKMGKGKLNPVIINYIRSLTFQCYPLEAHEKEHDEWARCIVAIDSSSRSLNKQQAARRRPIIV